MIVEFVRLILFFVMIFIIGVELLVLSKYVTAQVMTLALFATCSIYVILYFVVGLGF